jgi:hypothetical protein
MQLPGGISEPDGLKRDFAFHTVTGELELALAEAAAYAANTPHAVTQVLARALSVLGEASPSPQRVAALCVPDRQFLMRQLQQHTGYASNWRSEQCETCGEGFDFFLDESELPVAPAGDSYPAVKLELNGTAVSLRVPDGSDQAAIAHIEDDNEARCNLLARCICLNQGDSLQWLEDIDESMLELLDNTLEELAPGITTQVQAVCPYCGVQQVIPLNPYALLELNVDELLGQLHQIAMHYHWSEPQILSLPQQRRWQYLRMIEQARGMSE